MTIKHITTLLTFALFCVQWLHAEPAHASTQGQNIIYVDLNANGNNDGSDWNNAFTVVQAAVDAAVSGDEIHIAEGLYQEGNEIYINKPLTLRGGFPTGGGTQDWGTHETLLDGNDSHRVIRAVNNSALVTIEGMTIQKGACCNSGDAYAAGIYGADLHLKHVIIRDNKASGNQNAWGGGVNGNDITIENSQITSNEAEAVFARAYGAAVYGESVHLINTQVTNNSSKIIYVDLSPNPIARSMGGGIFAEDEATVINSQVNNNTADATNFEGAAEASGGGIKVLTGSITATNSEINENFSYAFATANSTTSSTGGGIAANNSYISNSKVSKNQSISVNGSYTNHGAGIFATPGHVLICHHCVITDNHMRTPDTPGSFSGGGVYGHAELISSVIWGNIIETGFPPNGITASEHEGGTLTANHTLIKDQFPAGSNNIDATAPGFDPKFVNAAGGNYRLAVGSPLIDAGDFMSLPADVHDLDNDGDVSEGVPFDLDGITRVLAADVDIGAYEHHDLIFTDGFD